jgi:hypothetical protein
LNTTDLVYVDVSPYSAAFLAGFEIDSTPPVTGDTLIYDGVPAKYIPGVATCAGSLLIDQTAPQTVVNGAPIFDEGLDAGSALVTNVLDPVNPQDAVTLHTLTVAIGGVIPQPADIIPDGRLTYHNGSWKNGLKDDFNNSSIGPEWTQIVAGGSSISEDATKLSLISVVGANASIQQLVPRGCFDARCYVNVSSVAASETLARMIFWNKAKTKQIYLGLAYVVSWEFWHYDGSGQTNTATPGGLKAFWLRLVSVYDTTVAMYSTNAFNDPPDDDEWVAISSRAIGYANMIAPYWVGFTASGWTGHGLIGELNSFQFTCL